MIFAVRNYALFIVDVTTFCRDHAIITPDPWDIKARDGKFVIRVSTDLVEDICRVNNDVLERLRQY